MPEWTRSTIQSQNQNQNQNQNQSLSLNQSQSQNQNQSLAHHQSQRQRQMCRQSQNQELEPEPGQSLSQSQNQELEPEPEPEPGQSLNQNLSQEPEPEPESDPEPEPEPTIYAYPWGQFGDAFVNNYTNTFNVPTGAKSWARFANENASLYTFNFANSGTITFLGYVPSGADVDLNFRFERLPYPDIEPAFDTYTTMVSGTTEISYNVKIPEQASANIYISFLVFITTRDIDIVIKDVLVIATVPDVRTVDNPRALSPGEVINFNSQTDIYDLGDFGGATSELGTDPDGSANTVVQIIKNGYAESWTGTTIARGKWYIHWQTLVPLWQCEYGLLFQFQSGWNLKNQMIVTKLLKQMLPLQWPTDGKH